MDRNIFFSYGHDEYAEYVNRVKLYLEERGYNVFFDEEELVGSPDWEAKLENGLKNNDKVVFFITPYSARRPNGYCLNELAMALTYNRSIVPVMLKYEVPPLSIIRQQYLDMQSCFTDDGLDQVLFEKHSENLLNVLEGKQELDFEGAQARVHEELKPLDIAADFSKHKNIIGREWIVGEIDQWTQEYPDSKVLWITAQAGYGKSALAVYLANTHPDVAGIHFCNYNRPSSKDATRVIKTLAYHLQARQIDGYFDAIKYIDTKDKNAFELFNELIANPLNRCCENDHDNLFIVSDALDETLDDKDEELIDLLGSEEFEKGLPGFVKIIVISRPDPRLRETLSGLNLIELNVQQKENESDCKALIKFRLQQLKQSKYKIDTELIEKVINDENFIKAILDKSQANMLYLNIFFKEVEALKIDLNDPNTFPKGLNGIYKGFFKRITTDEDKYDEVYAPLLEVILAYGEPIPKLLLRDILDLDLKQFNRTITNLGSMLNESDAKLDLYHKSLKDWLINQNENKTYLVDIEAGENIFNSFIEKLSSESYRIEYKKDYYYFFNKKIAETIYKKDKSFERFFDLINLSSESEDINLLNMLGFDYYAHYQIDKSIELLEKVYKLQITLYDNDPDEYIVGYTASMSILANSYNKNNQPEKAIELEKERLEITAQAYKRNPDEWFEEYTTAINNLAYSYDYFDNVQEAIKLKEQNLDLTRKRYVLYPEKAESDYTIALSNLAYSYLSIKRVDDAIKLQEECVDIIRKAYINDSENNNFYATTISNLATMYDKVNKSNEAIELYEESLRIRKKLYEDAPEFNSEDYIMGLYNLSMVYNQAGKIESAIAIAEEAINITQLLYKVNQNVWGHLYGVSLASQGKNYYKKKEIKQAIQLQEKSLEVIESLYINNTKKFTYLYTETLVNLASYYSENNEVYNAIETVKVSLEIFRSLYPDNKIKWLEGYKAALNNLAYYYMDIGKENDGVILFNELYLVLSESYGKEHQATKKIALKLKQYKKPKKIKRRDVLKKRS